MLDRLKFWKEKDPEPIQSIGSLGGSNYFSSGLKVYKEVDGKLVELDKIEAHKIEGDGKAEFLGEGSVEEFKALEESDKGFTEKPFGL